MSKKLLGVFQNLKKNPIEQHYDLCSNDLDGELSLQTRDFERVYIGLPQGDIINRFETLLVEFWQLHCNV